MRGRRLIDMLGYAAMARCPRLPCEILLEGRDPAIQLVSLHRKRPASRIDPFPEQAAHRGAFAESVVE